MTVIVYNSALIGDAYAPSIDAAFVQLRAESGITPVVLPPFGGARTPAQEQQINPGGPRNSDHIKGRAVDIFNQRQLRDWNEARFLTILAAHGWHNVTVAGEPFSAEPWHFANQSSVPAGSGPITPIGNGTTPSRATRKGNSMTQVLYTTFPHSIADNDPILPVLKGYVGGSTLTNFQQGTGLGALVGDAPGTPANVQLSQLDQRLNEWAADHAGAWTDPAGKGSVQIAARVYPFEQFMALLAAYAAPLNVSK